MKKDNLVSKLKKVMSSNNAGHAISSRLNIFRKVGLTISILAAIVTVIIFIGGEILIGISMLAYTAIHILYYLVIKSIPVFNGKVSAAKFFTNYLIVFTAIILAINLILITIITSIFFHELPYNFGLIDILIYFPVSFIFYTSAVFALVYLDGVEIQAGLGAYRLYTSAFIALFSVLIIYTNLSRDYFHTAMTSMDSSVVRKNINPLSRDDRRRVCSRISNVRSTLQKELGRENEIVFKWHAVGIMCEMSLLNEIQQQIDQAEKELKQAEKQAEKERYKMIREYK